MVGRILPKENVPRAVDAAVVSKVDSSGEA